jgi:signal transduction histidine kinase
MTPADKQDGYRGTVRTTSDYPAARPPLSMRLRPGHWTALDYLSGVLIAVLLFTVLRPSVVTPVGLVSTYHAPLGGPLAGFLLLAAALAVALRRRHPVLMLGVLLVDSAALTALAGRPVSPAVFFLPVLYVLYIIAATYEQRRDAVHVLTAVFATLLIDTQLEAMRATSRFNGHVALLVSLCVITVWTAGYTMRQRRRYAVRLQAQAASKAVSEERLRIARELHDVVAHSMSVIAVQAGYGQYVIDAQPQDARAALGAIQATSREALDEMRRMLGALRQADDADARKQAAGPRPPGSGADGVPHEPGLAGDSGGSPLSPAPGLADLDRLVSRTAGAGVRVDVTRFGPPRELPPGIDLSAYRVVQEALTNVVKHARTGSCRVLLGFRDDELTIEVIDDGTGAAATETAGAGAAQRESAGPGGAGLQAGAVLTLDAAQGRAEAPSGRLRPDLPDGHPGGQPGSLDGTGHGIIGMRERVTLLGGQFSAGPQPGRGFQVRARIPLPPRSA